ncbi:MAG: FHA domain-containing protein [Phycisphaerae bacterium]|nr:FHA domain-containing protein [Phycisphaerae bacterium]
MPSLLVMQGPDAGRRFRPVDGKPVLLGRASKEMPLTDYTVSRRHAELRPAGRGWNLDDLKSANGTFVNGKRLERPTRLKDGDQIRMGSTMLVWDGSEEKSLGTSDAETTVVTELVDLDSGSPHLSSSIIDSVGNLDDSMILVSPAAAEAVRSWRVISALLEAVGAVLSPHQLAQRVMDVLFEEVPADRGFILLSDPKKGGFETEIVRYKKEDSQERIRASKTIIDHVIKHREGVLCSNAMTDARFSGKDEDGSIQAMGLQSVVCVPLIAHEEVLGVIYVDCPMATHIYTEEQLRLVAALGQMAGLAIEDARLVNERMRTERLAATGETVAHLSHSIKNILQGMMGGSDIVAMGLRNKALPTVDQGWQIVHRNLDRIYSLTMNMLAYAKRREPKMEPVQFSSLVQDVLKGLRRRADDKGVLLQGAVDDVMPPILIDENGIQQVVLNIVANAIDAAPKTTGVVNIKASFDADTEEAVLTVGDNGPGIPEKDRQRVFDAFYSTKGHGGTGLGLAVAKKIVDEHFGKIEITSIRGSGTLIRVRIPSGGDEGLDSAATHGPGS